MSEQQPLETTPSGTAEPKPDTSIMTISKTVVETEHSQPEQRPARQESEKAPLAADAHVGSTLFQQFVMWLSLLLVTISLWLVYDLRSDIAYLNESLGRLQISLDWLEDDQNSHHAQTQQELNHYQAQLKKLRSNFRQGGLDDRDSQLATRINQLEERLQTWAQPTSAAADAPGLNTLKGKWAINLKSSDDNDTSVKDALADFKQAGIPASISSARVGTKTWHRLSVNGFGTYADAKLYAENVLNKRDIKNYWIRLAE